MVEPVRNSRDAEMFARRDLRDEPCDVPEILVLNDQVGGIMSVSDKPATLRAQMKHHEPIICFEPGIAKREGGCNRFVMDKSTTVRANMGDNQMAVCFAIKTKQIDMRTADNEAHPLDMNDDKEPQAVCYAIDQQGGKNNCSYAKDVMVTLCSDSHGTPHGVCYEKRDGED